MNDTRGAIGAGLVLTLVASVSFTAGLVAIYLAKTHTVQSGKDWTAASIVRMAATALVLSGIVLVGSIASLPFQFMSNQSAVCELAHLSGRSCTAFMATSPIASYLIAIAKHYGVPFFLEIFVGLIIARASSQLLNSPDYTGEYGARKVSLLQSFALAAWFSVAAPVVQPIMNTRRELSCDGNAWWCQMLYQMDSDLAWACAHWVSQVIAPWLNFTGTVAGSFGNQYKMAALYPLLFIGIGTWKAFVGMRQNTVKE